MGNDLSLSDSKVDFNRIHFAATTVALIRLKDTWKYLQGEGWCTNNKPFYLTSVIVGMKFSYLVHHKSLRVKVVARSDLDWTTMASLMPLPRWRSRLGGIHPLFVVWRLRWMTGGRSEVPGGSGGCPLVFPLLVLFSAEFGYLFSFILP